MLPRARIEVQQVRGPCGGTLNDLRVRKATRAKYHCGNAVQGALVAACVLVSYRGFMVGVTVNMAIRFEIGFMIPYSMHQRGYDWAYVDFLILIAMDVEGECQGYIRIHVLVVCSW